MTGQRSQDTKSRFFLDERSLKEALARFCSHPGTKFAIEDVTLHICRSGTEGIVGSDMEGLSVRASVERPAEENSWSIPAPSWDELEAIGREVAADPKLAKAAQDEYDEITRKYGK